jgi:cysteinyl-tRNA synthetase
MSIHIYNSLTKKKEELTPLDGKTIKMYSCGVTVYDKCHIGHARSLYIFDVIRRYLAHRGYAVRFIRNITDVDDKIINKSKELQKPFDEVVRENIEAYERDLKSLGVDKADVEPRATQYIPKMIAFITALMEKGFAYEVEGDVYFSVRQFKGYGKLSGQSIDQMIEATRIEQDPKKRDPLDFALWKKTKDDEKSWPSPWGYGRPGWHIECSCMSMNELNSETIDIHAGGRDLIFPHHENEIAQSEALTGKPFSKYWIHHGLLTINGQKMSKSLKNFITLDEVLEKYSNNILKLFFLQSHYASPIDFSWEKMEEVKKGYDRIAILMTKLEKIKKPADGKSSDWGLARQEEIKTAMDDDFNTPKALSVLHDMVNECNKVMDSDTEGKHPMLREARDLLKDIARILGLDFIKDSRISEEEENLLSQRIEARKKKDFRRSDELRDLLKKKGIVVEDTKEGQVWRRE